MKLAAEPAPMPVQSISRVAPIDSGSGRSNESVPRRPRTNRALLALAAFLPVALLGGLAAILANNSTEAKRPTVAKKLEAVADQTSSLATVENKSAAKPTDEEPPQAKPVAATKPRPSKAPSRSVSGRFTLPRASVSSGRNHVSEFQAYKRAEAQMHLQMAERARQQERSIRSQAGEMQQDIMRRQTYEYEQRLNRALPGFQRMPSYMMPSYR